MKKYKISSDNYPTREIFAFSVYAAYFEYATDFHLRGNSIPGEVEVSCEGETHLIKFSIEKL